MTYLAPWYPALILVVAAALLSVAMIVVATVLGPKRPSEVKDQPFESGMVSVGSARERFSVKFYLVALLFIVFDVEAVFVYPWASLLHDFQHSGLGWFAYGEMVSFMATVAVGLVYVWKKGALEWGEGPRASSAAKPSAPESHHA